MMRLVFGFLPHCRTDVWALGACLYSLAYLQNCFEEGSNLAILSNKYTIPEDNPYGEGLVELLDRMLCVDSKARADMTEVILCLSAVYSGRPLPPRKKSSKASKTEGAQEGDDAKTEEKIGTFRTDSQGYQETLYDPTKATEGKKLASNSVAARRKRAAASSASSSLPPTAPTPTTSAVSTATETPDPLAFSSFSEEKGGGDAGFGSEVGFGEMKGEFCMHALRIYFSERHMLTMFPSCLYRI
jgi:serine/threonine protein kinase